MEDDTGSDKGMRGAVLKQGITSLGGTLVTSIDSEENNGVD